jgi:CheY-like chemotaxis protein
MPCILLVDDDDLFRTMLAKKLAKFGYETLELRSGKDALTKYEQGHIDLLLTDLVMPEKEGLETIMELKSKYPQAVVVAMSGGGRGSAENYLELAKALGANHVLTKPFSDEDLKKTIQEAIGG